MQWLVPSSVRQLVTGIHTRAISQKEKMLWLDQGARTAGNLSSTLVMDRNSHEMTLAQPHRKSPYIYSTSSEVTFYLYCIECDQFPVSVCNIKLQCKLSQELVFLYIVKVRFIAAKPSTRRLAASSRQRVPALGSIGVWWLSWWKGSGAFCGPLLTGPHFTFSWRGGSRLNGPFAEAHDFFLSESVCEFGQELV